jgi:pimeloyl-ACP methyl ester carboxylesterase
VDVDIALKNRHTTARLAWEPRLHDPHLPKWLHRIDVPVKIVWGREDRILPVGLAEPLKKLIPGSELHILEKCGHLPHVEKAEQLVEILCR